ncbi:MAG: MgtC/SapB family protein [Flavobacteriia bacterium]|nr:MgtC/SapB family protein [Flavobacteriia bacterium]OJX35933.1 MAG: hypothetical protein BGO87_05540 [Flavobacteriia bacterium 40-80]
MAEGWHLFMSQWETLDLFKILFSVIAGLIFGVERELKDKSAGLKTITIICLGSTVFTLLSYKMGAGASEDATRIASYVVSGIGFLGAGVIFKNKYAVSGLTTAAIIWAAAAVGMAIGFGEFLIALYFLVAVSIVLLTGRYISTLLFSGKVTRIGHFSVKKEDYDQVEEIFQELKSICKIVEKKSMALNGDILTINVELVVLKKRNRLLENILVNNPFIFEFSV